MQPQQENLNYDALIDDILNQEVADVPMEADTVAPMEWEMIAEWEAPAIVEEEILGEAPLPQEGEIETTEEVVEETPADEVVEEVVEDVVEEPVAEEQPADDIDSQIDKELAMINTAQAKVEEIQAEVDMDEQIQNSEAYMSLQSKLSEVTSLLDDREMEIEQTKAQLTKYKDRLSENTSYLADKELEDITSRPILSTVEADSDLKAAVLSLSKAKETDDEFYKNEALNHIYDFIQREAGVDVRRMVWDTSMKETKAMWAGESMWMSESKSKRPPQSPAEKGIEMALGGF